MMRFLIWTVVRFPSDQRTNERSSRNAGRARKAICTRTRILARRAKWAKEQLTINVGVGYFVISTTPVPMNIQGSRMLNSMMIG